jgi:integrase/recombinase XerD
MTKASAGTPQYYVQQLRLHSPLSSRNYRSILNGFQRFVAEQAEDKSISPATVRQWLNDRIKAWPLHLVTDRARIVDRYLDWMVDQNALANNPFAQLRREYGQRATKPVVQALLRRDFEAALEAPLVKVVFRRTEARHEKLAYALGGVGRLLLHELQNYFQKCN